MYGLQEHEMRFYCLFKKVYFSLLATSDFFCRHAYAYAHMRIIRHETDMAAYAWPSLVHSSCSSQHCEFQQLLTEKLLNRSRSSAAEMYTLPYSALMRQGELEGKTSGHEHRVWLITSGENLWNFNCRASAERVLPVPIYCRYIFKRYIHSHFRFIADILPIYCRYTYWSPM